MDIIKNIKNNTLLIVPKNIKNKILKELDTLDDLLNIKIMDMDEIIKHLYFSYDVKSIIYLMKNYNLSYNTSKLYIKNMYFVDSETSSNKLNNLLKIKTEMLNNNLLITDPFFINYIKNKNIVIYGYDYYTKYDLKVIDRLKEYTSVNVFYKVEAPKKNLKAYEFQTIEEEVLFVAEEITNLYKNNVDLNQIKLFFTDKEYEKEIKKIFKIYNIPFDLGDNTCLFDIKIGMDVINLIKNNTSFSEVIDSLENKYDVTLINKIINIFNKYVFIDNPIEVIDFIKDDLKNTYIDKPKLKEKIELIDIYNNEIDFDTYVFVMGFNNSLIPSYKKDEDYISDKLKEEINISPSYEINEYINKSTINILNSVNNLYITYKLRTPFNEYMKSLMIDDYNIEVVKKEIDSTTNYKYNRIFVGKMIDDLIKFGKHNENIDKLYKNMNFDYLSYNNEYKNIDNKSLNSFLDNKITLSYSSLNNYFGCSFKYYLTNILKLDTFSDTLAVKIGNIFHHILSVKNNDDFDIDKLYDIELDKLRSENKLSIKEEFYLEKLKDNLKDIVNEVNNQKLLSGLNEELMEENFNIIKNINGYTVKFTGFIDKIMMLNKNNETYLSIIDYKTGNPDIDLTYITNGLKLQLPTYMYLVKNSEKFKNAKICGIYLQHILKKVSGSKKGYESEFKDSLKLSGYSTSDKSRLELFDSTYEKSEMITGMGIKKDGDFKSSAKILDDNEINKIIDITESKIEEATLGIINAEFDINPKRYEDELIGCKYCNFKDICYRKEEDIKDIEIPDNLDFLKEEGDNYA